MDDYTKQLESRLAEFESKIESLVEEEEKTNQLKDSFITLGIDISSKIGAMKANLANLKNTCDEYTKNSYWADGSCSNLADVGDSFYQIKHTAERIEKYEESVSELIEMINRSLFRSNIKTSCLTVVIRIMKEKAEEYKDKENLGFPESAIVSFEENINWFSDFIDISIEDM